MKLPKKISRGENITAQWLNEFVDAIHSLVPRPSHTIRVEQTNNGVCYHATIRNRRGIAVETITPPFFVYQAKANPINLTTDWRTLAVSGDGSTINGLHCDNDENSGTPVRLVIPASTPNYAVWIKLTLNVTTGAITARTIEGGTTGLPAQPAPAIAGQYPGFYYILITDNIVTTDDLTHQLTIPETQTTSTSLGAGQKITNSNCLTGAIVFSLSFEHWATS